MRAHKRVGQIGINDNTIECLCIHIVVPLCFMTRTQAIIVMRVLIVYIDYNLREQRIRAM